jgi:hypothetical protein
MRRKDIGHGESLSQKRPGVDLLRAGNDEACTLHRGAVLHWLKSTPEDGI